MTKNDYEIKILKLTRTISALRRKNKTLAEENAALQMELTARDCPAFVANGEIMSVEPNIYDQEERHENCTVQILRNSLTGAYSFGWWDNEP